MENQFYVKITSYSENKWYEGCKGKMFPIIDEKKSEYIVLVDIGMEGKVKKRDVDVWMRTKEFEFRKMLTLNRIYTCISKAWLEDEENGFFLPWGFDDVLNSEKKEKELELKTVVLKDGTKVTTYAPFPGFFQKQGMSSNKTQASQILEEAIKSMVDIQSINSPSPFSNNVTLTSGFIPLITNEPIIPKNILLEDMEFTFGQCLQTAIAKNSDYGGSNNDPYANFRNSTIAGVKVEQGILVRMSDKMSRIGTLLQKEAKVKDEAIEDTLMDLINYAAILKSYLKNNKDGSGDIQKEI